MMKIAYYDTLNHLDEVHGCATNRQNYALFMLCSVQVRTEKSLGLYLASIIATDFGR